MNDSPITSNDIKTYLDEQSDFTLEMMVFNHLSESNYEVSHGGTYTDPVTDKPRQFDIRCVKRLKNKSIKMAVECKALNASFPFVIQRVPRTKMESFHEVICSQDEEEFSLGQPLLLSPAETLRTRLYSGMYPPEEPVGKSCNQIGRRKDGLYANDKDIYEKWSQAISSAYDLIYDSTNENVNHDVDKYYSIVIPILVVSNHTLWGVDYDQKGKRISEPKEENHVEFFLDKEWWIKGTSIPTYTISHLHVMTYDGFASFSDRIAVNEKYWYQDVFFNDFKKKQ